MASPRIAVLGAGFMGGTHARAYRQVPNVEIAAIYAQSLDRAQPLADELGVPSTTDLDAILADASIDAVDICLPTPAHREVTEAAISAGKHVLLEKPLALSEADGEAIVAAADRTDKVVMIAHVLRFWPEYVALKEIVDSGRLGAPVAVNAVRRQPFPAWSKLFATAERTGGAIYDMLIHDFDAITWLLGTPTRVAAQGVVNPRSGGIDQAQVLIQFGDRSGVVDGGMIQPESYPFTSRLEVLCEHGAVEYHFQAGGRSFEVGEPVNRLTVYPAEGDPETLTAEQVDAYVAEVGYFVECVASGQPALRATPRDALLASQVGLAAKRSAETGDVVTL